MSRRDDHHEHDDEQASRLGGRGAEDGDTVGFTTPAGLFGGSDPFGGGDDGDEDALRRMMRGVVQGLEPSEGSLDRLQRAVPARRARRRQALVGAAAAALLIGTAVPAFVHVANSEGSSTASPAIAGHGEQAQGGNGDDPGADSGNGGGGESGGGQPNGGQGLPESTVSPSASSGKGDDGAPAGASADPAVSAAGVLPPCDAAQLGVRSARSGAAGADGTVYGSFRIANVSGTDCSVSSGGTVGFEAMGAADPARIAVVRHTAGDPASGLPDPAAEEATVLLKPDMAYEVQFAWVPDETCPSTGGSPSPTPTDGTTGAGSGGSAGAVAAGGTGETESGTETQFGTADGVGTAQGSVSVQHTPEPGAPVAATMIDNACAGTIYRTGVLEPSSS
ncbi:MULTISPECIES: hypothetical protein [unclassified Streptomyces]|uniref:hypothetical protein n=1 Tax=unclassified Streptomyces TaxID=2593676 RepID=UPI002ED69F2B|nr:hypothetical protein OH827_15365 [Streptomyces sp. NBC_00891]WSY06307.1 hypothetical protein OG464_15365 [Streptomyces sp. NBC_00890]WSZ07932.1 hypothetical protein OG704_15365 [Streptomyces sp. NBC_00869]WSZ24569.1 hypothetical protein OG498_18200 [Streptomyces sp. NBC_00870]